MMVNEVQETLSRAEHAHKRYGSFASTHEVMGVILEEWGELQTAIQANKLGSVREECLDIAAVCLRLAHACENDEALIERSRK
jgi:NTP pyrophosphatase (non-canonical NTP hydrolase)